MSGAPGRGGEWRPLLRLAHRAAFALGLAWFGLLAASGIYDSTRTERSLPGIADPSGPHLSRLFERGAYEQAARELRTALALDPMENWKRHYNLGLALSLQGELDAAIEEFERAAQLAPGEAGVHADLGKALRAKGEEARAIEHLERAAQLRAELPQGLQRRAGGRY